MTEKERGKLTVISATMFAGKTDSIITKAGKLTRYGRKKVSIFKPATDTRSDNGFIASDNGKRLEAIEVDVNIPEQMVKYLQEHPEITKVFIDEAQFFPPTKKFIRVVIAILEMGLDVTAAGLPLDFRGEPFGAMPYFLSLADEVILLNDAHCSKCGETARLPQRLVNDKSAHYNEPIVAIGGSTANKDNIRYEVRCYKCHELPGKPSF
ncbi:MAG: thymidine kinase [bacterium]|nr:thymidine kinase [bacterium]